MATHSVSGYVTDVPYAPGFFRELAPAWLDFVVTLSGFEPPAHDGGFAWCELGCGMGVTAALIAATNPTGEFHAIDAIPEHVDYGRRLAHDAGITNLSFHGVDFAAALDLELPSFDYIVAHGVYTWIDARARDEMRRFIDQRLKPGGVVFVSYNAMPGWANDTPFQFLVSKFAAASAGNAVERFVQAMTHIETLTAAGAPALEASSIATSDWEEQKTPSRLAYLAHEYLPLAWQPMYVSQVRADMAAIGLAPAGSATIAQNFDSFMLRPAAREALASIAKPDLRELARDFFLNQRFRRDVFVRSARRIGNDERASRLSDCVFDLHRPRELIEYALVTTSGRVDIDSPAARAIVHSLSSGPMRLSDIPADGLSRRELLAGALALAAASEVRPVAPGSAVVERVNRAVLSGVTGPDGLRHLALPCGTAVDLPISVLHALRDGAKLPDELSIWPDFLRRYDT